MFIFINIVFFSVIIYNLIKRRQNVFKANLPTVSILAACILAAVGFIFWYSNDNSIIGLITLVNALLFFLSFFLAIGISDKYLNCFMVNSIVVLSVPYSEIKEIRISKSENKIKLIIKAHGQEFLQEYNLSLEDQIIEFIDSHFIISVIR